MERTANVAREVARLFVELIGQCEEAEALARQRLSLNATDFTALKLLCEHQDLGPAALSRALHISSSSTTAVLDRLQDHGYISRTLHPTDRRRSSITVNTALIADPLAAAHSLARDVDDVIMSMPSAVRDQLLSSLRELNARMRHTISQLTAPPTTSEMR